MFRRTRPLLGLALVIAGTSALTAVVLTAFAGQAGATSCKYPPFAEKHPEICHPVPTTTAAPPTTVTVPPETTPAPPDTVVVTGDTVPAVVEAAPPVSAPPAAPPAQTGQRVSAKGGSLPEVGWGGAPLVVLAAFLLAGGLAVVALARRPARRRYTR